VDAIHDQFILAVREGRGDRLVKTEEAFSGLVWTGAQSVDIGLVDGLNDVAGVARELVGVDRIVEFSVGGSLLDRLAQRVETAFTQVLSQFQGVQALY